MAEDEVDIALNKTPKKGEKKTSRTINRTKCLSFGGEKKSKRKKKIKELTVSCFTYTFT